MLDESIVEGWPVRRRLRTEGANWGARIQVLVDVLRGIHTVNHSVMMLYLVQPVCVPIAIPKVTEVPPLGVVHTVEVSL